MECRTTMCAERRTTLAWGCHSLSLSASEGDADVENKMMWLCMQCWARNAKKAILAVHYRECHLKLAGCKEAAGAEDIILSIARTRGSIPKHAMSEKAECGSWCNYYKE